MNNPPKTRSSSKAKEVNTRKYDKDDDALMTACGIPEEFKEMAWHLFCLGREGDNPSGKD
jgi:hypothetical protein